MFQGRDFGREFASPKLGSAQAIEWRNTSGQATFTSTLHPQTTFTSTLYPRVTLENICICQALRAAGNHECPQPTTTNSHSRQPTAIHGNQQAQVATPQSGPSHPITIVFGSGRWYFKLLGSRCDCPPWPPHLWRHTGEVSLTVLRDSTARFDPLQVVS
jgi:hypothetical protein